VPFTTFWIVTGAYKLKDTMFALTFDVERAAAIDVSQWQGNASSSPFSPIVQSSGLVTGKRRISLLYLKRQTKTPR
jgi:hypothetical protein